MPSRVTTPDPCDKCITSARPTKASFRYINRKAPARPTWCVAQRGAAPCLVVICSVMYSHSFYMGSLGIVCLNGASYVQGVCVLFVLFSIDALEQRLVICEKWRAKRFRIARQTESAPAEPLSVVPRTTAQQPTETQNPLLSLDHSQSSVPTSSPTSPPAREPNQPTET